MFTDTPKAESCCLLEDLQHSVIAAGHQFIPRWAVRHAPHLTTADDAKANEVTPTATRMSKQNDKKVREGVVCWVSQRAGNKRNTSGNPLAKSCSRSHNNRDIYKIIWLHFLLMM